MRFFSLERLKAEYKCLKTDGKIALAIYLMAFFGIFIDGAVKINKPQYREKIDYGLDIYFLIVLAATMLYVPLRIDHTKLDHYLKENKTDRPMPVDQKNVVREENKTNRPRV